MRRTHVQAVGLRFLRTTAVAARSSHPPLLTHQGGSPAGYLFVPPLLGGCQCRFKGDIGPSKAAPKSILPSLKAKPIAAYNVEDGTSIVVDVREDKVNPGKFLVDGLREAIADKEKYDRAAFSIKIFRHCPDGTKGDLIKDGELPANMVGFAFEIQSAAAEATAMMERTIAEAVSKYDQAEEWTRPTPRPKELYRFDTPQYWDSQKRFPCTAPLPRPTDLSPDGRYTAIGISNAVGTGKTEQALRGAELTAQEERNIEVAYCSFSGGYYGCEVDATLRDHSVVNSDGNKKMFTSKYAGLWLFAAKKATKLENGQVMGNREMFNAIVCTFLKHLTWPLPHYNAECSRNLIAIFDDVQLFQYDDLDSFVRFTVVPTVTRMTLLVGAYSPTFGFTGNRLLDCRFGTVSAAETEKLFETHITTDTKEEGLELSSLLHPCMRAVSEGRGMAIRRNDDPIAETIALYSNLYKKCLTPGVIFRAAIAGVSVGYRLLSKQFEENNVSLRAAFLRPCGVARYLVQQPPALVATGSFELIDANDAEAASYCKEVVSNFASPNWGRFAALAGIAPALRIAALTHYNEMEYNFDRDDILKLVFGSCVMNREAGHLLKKKVNVWLGDKGLQVRKVNGCKAVSTLALGDFCDAANIVLVPAMDDDHNSTFDHFLIVPLRQRRFLVMCIDSKFGDGLDDKLNYTEEVEAKFPDYEAHTQGRAFPENCDAVVVIISNKKCAANLLDGKATKVPLIVCGRQHLSDVLSPPFVPPKYAAKGKQ